MAYWWKEHEDGTVTTSKEYMHMLLKDSLFLESLEDSGVNTWEGYYEAFQKYYKHLPKEWE